jgi:hypothetical protein
VVLIFCSGRTSKQTNVKAFYYTCVLQLADLCTATKVNCTAQAGPCRNPGTCNPATGVCDGVTDKKDGITCSSGSCSSGTCTSKALAVTLLLFNCLQLLPFALGTAETYNIGLMFWCSELGSLPADETEMSAR